MCSGLNNQCIESTAVLDIVVSFNKNNLKYTFSLPLRIAEDSKVDLILGLETIKKLNLVKIIPEFFQNPENIENEKIKSLQKLNHSTNMVLNQVDVPLLLEAESDAVTSITDCSRLGSPHSVCLGPWTPFRLFGFIPKHTVDF